MNIYPQNATFYNSTCSGLLNDHIKIGPSELSYDGQTPVMYTLCILYVSPIILSQYVDFIYSLTHSVIFHAMHKQCT